MIIVQGDLKLIDFEGYSIDGSGPTSSYEWFSYKPSTPRATVQTDIFDLGCAICEIVTGKTPTLRVEGNGKRTGARRASLRKQSVSGRGRSAPGGLDARLLAREAQVYA